MLGSGEVETTPNVHTIKCEKESQAFWYTCAEGIVETDGQERWGTVGEGAWRRRFPEEGILEQNPVEADMFCKMVHRDTRSTLTKENDVKKG